MHSLESCVGQIGLFFMATYFYAKLTYFITVLKKLISRNKQGEGSKEKLLVANIVVLKAIKVIVTREISTERIKLQVFKIMK